MNKRAAILILGLAIGLAYFNALNGQFLYDDEFLIQKNQIVQYIHLLPKSFSTSTTEGSGGNDSFYRPVQIAVYSILHWTMGPDPFWFHLLNVLLHFLNATLIFTLCLKIFNQWKMKHEFEAAFGVALLWALHPIHTEAISYISATADPLHFTFGLLFFHFGIKSGLVNLITAHSFFILALLTKESSVTFPALYLTLLMVFSHSLKKAIPSLLLAAIYVALRKTLLDFSDSFTFFDQANIYTESPLVRIYTGLAALSEYLKILIWPQHLQIDRQFPIYTQMLTLKVLIGFILTALSIVPFLLFKNKNYKLLIFFPLWFWSYHLLHTGFILPLNSFFLEHWMYVPSLALAMALILIFQKYLHSFLRRSLIALLALMMAVKIHEQNKVWANPISLYTHILKSSPDIARAHNNLAMALSEKGNFSEAKTHYLKSISISDVYPQVRHNLGLLYLRNQQFSEGIYQLEAALKMDPQFYHSHLYLEKAYQALGNFEKAKFHQLEYQRLLPELVKPPEMNF